MQRVSWKDRLRYAFDNTFSRGPAALIAWLGLLSLGVLLTACTSSLSSAWSPTPGVDFTSTPGAGSTAVTSTIPTDRGSTPSPQTPVPSGTSSTPIASSEVAGTPSLECLSSTVAAEAGVVMEVLDGDTILVSLDGILKSVRYIGIDSPERGDAASTAATLGNAELVYEQEVTLIRDVSDMDRYDRLLRYVLVDGVFVNLELVSRGLAVAKDYPPDSSCARVFAEAEFQARSVEAGIWAFALPVEAVTSSAANATLGRGCDPSYPTVCIPSPPPDLDCGDVSSRRFQVKPPDPHRFDGDHDGIGCEG